jgi:hypothetical protein
MRFPPLVEEVEHYPKHFAADEDVPRKFAKHPRATKTKRAQAASVTQ